MVPRTGFEPVVSALRGRCPGPLDERGALARRLAKYTGRPGPGGKALTAGRPPAQKGYHQAIADVVHDPRLATRPRSLAQTDPLLVPTDAVAVPWAGLPGQRRLHGPGQLGDRHRGRRQLWV